MRTPAENEPGTETVIAAQRGDRKALDAVVAGYLPLLYNIVGRAMNGHADTDDVVQETLHPGHPGAAGPARTRGVPVLAGGDRDPAGARVLRHPRDGCPGHRGDARSPHRSRTSPT